MKNRQFKNILSKIPDLNHDQRVIIKDAVDHGSDMDCICDQLQQNFEKTPHCVYCQSKMIIRNGFRSGLTRYRCKCCKKSFNALTGTPFARLRNKERWLEYLQCMIDSKTIRKSAEVCSVHRNTAFRWRHRFLKGSHASQPKLLSGLVEADETYFRESHKGSNKLTRPGRKRGKEGAKRGLSKDQVCVLVACDRNGNQTDYIAGTGPVSSQWLQSHFKKHISSDCVLITDGAASFSSFCSKLAVKHKIVINKEGLRVQGAYHIQNVNSYHSSLKTWMRRFNGVATKYLNNYLSWCHKLKGHIDPPKSLLDELIVG